MVTSFAIASTRPVNDSLTGLLIEKVLNLLSSISVENPRSNAQGFHLAVRHPSFRGVIGFSFLVKFTNRFDSRILYAPECFNSSF